MHAQMTSATILDGLIGRYPERLSYFRSLGIWQTFKQDYAGAVDTFTIALTNAKTLRKAKDQYRRMADQSSKGSKKRGKKKIDRHAYSGEAPDSSAASPLSASGEDSHGLNGSHSSAVKASLRSSACSPVCEEAAEMGNIPGDDIERQLLFFRAMAHFQCASAIIEEKVLSIEGVHKPLGGLSNEGGELTLENIGIAIHERSKTPSQGNLIGSANAAKLAFYRRVLAINDHAGARHEIIRLFKQSNKDFEKFLSHFAVWESPSGSPHHDFEEQRKNDSATKYTRLHSEKYIPQKGRKLINHQSLHGRTRYGDPRTAHSSPQLS